MSYLLNKKCVPCEGKTKPLSKKETKVFMKEISGWRFDKKYGKISKEFEFEDFVDSILFVNKISQIAEEEGHHPNIHIFYNKVLVELSTHDIKGLSENDFIIAAKIDALV
ncbi:4a-hydroxytetrahydrobiopterin dehydratase [Candidatus Nomurabacteria bacterium CG_4_9_14_0_2_um_filter_32_10]|uniref:Putative pterin-4-alpha-carbinolamine dehydratase n=3 Tax=Candidatus Nomuraibacteriota TaxID=1752729 RepID=A0A2H0CGW0_9BACT|nr:MAG: 4a-hydroxytetrahydrobiopterin dehydratase [Candidatus Nomurabacteria bacterium CG22_combo_CG10-13_8_21_14_all_32_8]PIZ86350.1 MAG: 4a-hydroxytetrahydrobiopterin dehydratase [Candidatus Nomurabacteria bacterium CG_4_10_14_0_2_um_filter_33_9]PJC49676.1 MAG: 4a-hydroxytetrahydrobiopterin dehydratase [Candidatus Nomurabacteria bacterium CG_4_9_14_0_2_um_filter_32_10]